MDAYIHFNKEKNKNNVVIVRHGNEYKIHDLNSLKGNGLAYLGLESPIVKDDVRTLLVDGSQMVILKTSEVKDLLVHETQYIRDYFDDAAKDAKQFVAEKENLFSHGETVREAISDLFFKIESKIDVSDHVKRIKNVGYLTPNDYRLLTGSCHYGVNKFLQDNNLTWDVKVKIEDLKNLVLNNYGSEKAFELLGV
jgi:hypothetical protein